MHHILRRLVVAALPPSLPVAAPTVCHPSPPIPSSITTPPRDASPWSRPALSVSTLSPTPQATTRPSARHAEAPAPVYVFFITESWAVTIHP